jgi:hypothetical protein
MAMEAPEKAIGLLRMVTVKLALELRGPETLTDPSRSIKHVSMVHEDHEIHVAADEVPDDDAMDTDIPF